MKKLVAVIITTLVLASPAVAHAQLTGTVIVTNPAGVLGWRCTQALDLDLLKITISGPDSNDGNAFTIDPGCTGTIDRIEIETNHTDAIKCRNNAVVNGHDLEINSGYLKTTGHVPGAHADGIQCMGGDRITFRNLLIDFRGAPGGGGFYPSLGGAGTGGQPEDIVCENCHIIHGATSVRVDASVRSGLRNSVVCAPVGQAEHANAVFAHGSGSLIAPVGVSRWPVTIRVNQNEDAWTEGNDAVPSSDPRCTTEPFPVPPPPPDSDGDGIPDSEDSCPNTPNTGNDTDQDGVDDACDPLPTSWAEIRAIIDAVCPDFQ